MVYTINLIIMNPTAQINIMHTITSLLSLLVLCVSYHNENRLSKSRIFEHSYDVILDDSAQEQ